MIVTCARTRDGRWRVLVHHDQHAELVDEHGRIVLGRVPLYRLGERLAELDIRGDDLIPD